MKNDANSTASTGRAKVAIASGPAELRDFPDNTPRIMAVDPPAPIRAASDEMMNTSFRRIQTNPASVRSGGIQPQVGSELRAGQGYHRHEFAA